MPNKTEILDKINLRALAEEAGAKFNHSNRSCCPLHQGDNPTAFYIYQTEEPDSIWRWRCFTGCPDGANGGDAITFYMVWQQVDYSTALDHLSKRLGHPEWQKSEGGRIKQEPSPAVFRFPPPKDPPPPTWQQRALQFVTYAQSQLWSPIGQSALIYLQEKRGLTPTTIRAWQLGYNPTDVYDLPARWGLKEGKKIWCARGIVYPNLRSGQVWSINIRRPLPGDDLATAIGPVSYLPKEKYIEPRGGRRGLFGLDHLSKHRYLILTEGEADCILAWQNIADIADVLTLGGARHQPDLLEAALLTRYSTILAIYDIDEPGQKGLAYLQSISQRIIPVLPPAHDLTDYYNTGASLGEWFSSLITPISHVSSEKEQPPISGPQPPTSTTVSLDDLANYLQQGRLCIIPDSLRWEPDPYHSGRQRATVVVAPINQESKF